jgi:hypothetical protein
VGSRIPKSSPELAAGDLPTHPLWPRVPHDLRPAHTPRTVARATDSATRPTPHRRLPNRADMSAHLREAHIARHQEQTTIPAPAGRVVQG